MKIAFPQIETWDHLTDCVAFSADLDDSRIACRISLEALQDNFGCVQLRPVECFKVNRARIEAKVETLVRRAQYESDGSILIRSRDGA